MIISHPVTNQKPHGVIIVSTRIARWWAWRNRRLWRKRWWTRWNGWKGRWARWNGWKWWSWRKWRIRRKWRSRRARSWWNGRLWRKWWIRKRRLLTSTRALKIRSCPDSWPISATRTIWAATITVKFIFHDGILTSFYEIILILLKIWPCKLRFKRFHKKK